MKGLALSIKNPPLLDDQVGSLDFPQEFSRWGDMRTASSGHRPFNSAAKDQVANAHLALEHALLADNQRAAADDFPLQPTIQAHHAFPKVYDSHDRRPFADQADHSTF